MSDQIEPGEPHLDLEPTTWPKVVGIISIGWGCFGLTCLACGVGGLLLSSSMLPAEMRNQPLPPTMQLSAVQAVLFAVGFVMSIILIAAGILTLRRSMAGRTLHLIWAVVSCLTVIVSIYLAWQQTLAMEQWLNDNPDSQFAKGPRVGRGASMAIAVGLNAIGLIWPAFCLIWFGAVKRTAASFGAAPVKDFI